MIVTYSRGGGWRPPVDRELLEIRGDGDFTMWRSVSLAAPVGRFAGRLDPATQDALRRHLESAVRAGSIELTAEPDAAFEGIVVKDEADQTTRASAGMGSSNQREGPWGDLVKELRRLLHDLTRFPRAAIALEMDERARDARLVQLGEEPLRLDLSGLTVRVSLWDHEDIIAGDWTEQGKRSGDRADVEARPGWSLDLPFDHDLRIKPGYHLAAYAILADNRIVVNDEQHRSRQP
jgi:hypothetical protein